LNENRPRLEQRDRGNKKYQDWYAFGRKQGLGRDPAPALFISSMASEQIPLIIKTEPVLFYSGLSIVPKDGANIETIQRVIQTQREWLIQNSSKRGGGWVNISAATLRTIPL
jgi:hypothetical protein